MIHIEGISSRGFVALVKEYINNLSNNVEGFGKVACLLHKFSKKLYRPYLLWEC
jgi:hypothetical protein